jgi:hypothetical protein
LSSLLLLSGAVACVQCVETAAPTGAVAAAEPAEPLVEHAAVAQPGMQHHGVMDGVGSLVEHN